MVLGFLGIHLVFAPGLLTADPAWMLQQAASGQINDWLSPLPTWILARLGISGSGWFTLTTIAFLVSASRILGRAYPRWMAGLLAAALACSPPVIGWLSVLSRDVWCGWALLTAVGLATGPQPPTTLRRVARGTGIVVALAVAISARQNAALPVLGVAALAVHAAMVKTPTVKRLVVAGTAGLAATAALVLSHSLVLRHVVHPLRTHPEQVTYVSDLAAMSFTTGKHLVPPGVWNSTPDYERLETVWSDVDGVAIYNVADPPVHTVYDDVAVRGIRNDWLRAIQRDPMAYLGRRAELLGLQLDEISRTDPYVPGMAAEFPGHVLARPHLVDAATDVQSDFWRLTRLRVWHLLVAGVVALWSLRSSRNWSLALGLQGVGWLTLISLIPTAPVAAYRFTWPSVTAALLTIALAVAERRSGTSRRGRLRVSDG